MKLWLISNFILIGMARAGDTVPVELDWEEVRGAKIYQLEFIDQQGKTTANFQSASSVFHFDMKVGRYKVRSRVADERKVYGEWSKFNDVVIPPKPVVLTEQDLQSKETHLQNTVDPKTRTAIIQFSWPESAGAHSYHVRVFDEKGKLVREKMLPTPSFKAELPAGEYNITVSSVGADDIESDPFTLPDKVRVANAQLVKPELFFESPPANKAVPSNPVVSSDAEAEPIRSPSLPRKNGLPVLRWKPLAYSHFSGVLEYRYFFGKEWLPVELFKENNVHEWVLSKATKPGRYRVTAWTEAEGLMKSEAVTYEFVVKPGTY